MIRACVVATLIGALLLCASTPGVPAAGGARLRDLPEAGITGIGAAVRAQPLSGETAYRDTLAREFNILVPENELKWDSVHPARDTYDFSVPDSMVAFAEAHQMRVFGHVFVWYWQLPAWLTDGGFSREELMSILEDHIKTVAGHYRGRVEAWDVVNEAVADDGSLRHTIWLDTIGPEYIDLAFQWAREADPDARLFYNDYGGEGLGAKSDAIYALVSDLKERGVPIDGVGLQVHTSIAWPPLPQDVAANIARLGALGLDVRISEMDVRIQDGTGTTEQKLAAQAEVYRNMANVCVASPACSAFMMWGFTDKYSWIPWFTGNPDWPLIFDESYEPKSAYWAVYTEFGGVGPVGGIVEPVTDLPPESPEGDVSRRFAVGVSAGALALVLAAILWRRNRSRS
jgi:endo-1,4-beta-xylanase